MEDAIYHHFTVLWRKSSAGKEAYLGTCRSHLMMTIPQQKLKFSSNSVAYKMRLSTILTSSKFQKMTPSQDFLMPQKEIKIKKLKLMTMKCIIRIFFLSQEHILHGFHRITDASIEFHICNLH